MEHERKVLVDACNIDQMLPQIIREVGSTAFVGFDIETHDADRHEGLNVFMKCDDEGRKSASKRLVFDTNRTVVTGFSIYPDENQLGYYVNLMHADVENRIPWEKVKPIIDAKRDDAYWVIHNAPFEWTMMLKSLGFDLGDKVMCTLQLCVSAYGPDTYFKERFLEPGLGDIEKFFPMASRVFAGWEPGMDMNNDQEDLFFKIVAKESKSSTSWNGYVNSISIGYDLKKAVKSWFGYQMETFAETLEDDVHMGQKTGEEVYSYGVDDAYWCMQLFHRVLTYIMETNPAVFETYLEQEMPASRIFSSVWQRGVKVNVPAIYAYRDSERLVNAQQLREMKKVVRTLLPFPEEPHEKLLKYDSWFYNEKKSPPTEGWKKYRKLVEQWAETPDFPVTDDMSDKDKMEAAWQQIKQIRSPISLAWAGERGEPEPKTLNIGHYMPMRTIIYDLLRGSYMQAEGKTQSDGDCREVLRERWIKRYNKEGPLEGVIMKDGKIEQELRDAISADVSEEFTELRLALERFEAGRDLFDIYKKMASLETRIKLYVTPYLNLIDPDTGRMYPQLTSMLATRRTACSTPNGQQLAKFGESVYIRGFYEADDDDAEGEEHCLVSADWSAVELVIVGDYSQDEGFADAYQQRPHKDLHKKAVMGLMDMTEEEYDKAPNKKELRRDIGKVGNFNYWFSGALGSVGELLGWSSDTMWLMVEKYRATFPRAEQWRVDTIQEAKDNGYVTLPDHHRRDRFEATPEWANIMRSKFEAYGDRAVFALGQAVIRKTQTRAGNQAVNAKVQGLCAALAKRAAIRIDKRLASTTTSQGKPWRVRFWLLVHDELIFSCPRSQTQEFLALLYEEMIKGAGLIEHLKLDSSLAIGRTLHPWDLKKAPNGQIELMEMQKGIPVISKDRYDQRATQEEIAKLITYIFDGEPPHEDPDSTHEQDSDVHA